MREPAILTVCVFLFLSETLVADEWKKSDPPIENKGPSDNLFSVIENEDRLVILHHQKPAANFVFRDSRILRPYFSNVCTSSGLQVTRNHPPIEGVDAVDHADMHPGLWLGFGDINGNDFWRNKARIDHLRFTTPPTTTNDQLTFSTESNLVGSSGEPLCKLDCRFVLKSRENAWLLVWDAAFHSQKAEITFGDQEEMGFGARIATAMTEKNGGRILNSAGQQSAKLTWGQTAQWCDYSGRADDRSGGITLMAAPSNFRPSWWHNRDYGLLVANPFGRAAMKQGEKSEVDVRGNESLRVVFGALVHDELQTNAAEEFDFFAKLATP